MNSAHQSISPCRELSAIVFHSVDAAEALKLYRALSRATGLGLIRSCHDCSDGGLGIALAESAFAGGLGMHIDLRTVPCQGIARSDYLLFSESQSRFVVTIDPGKVVPLKRV